MIDNNNNTRSQYTERQVGIASRILYLGLNSQHGEIDEYTELYENLTRNPQIRSLVEIMADRFNLDILDISKEMITLSPKPRSLFATRAEDYEFVTSASDKPIFGLILLSVAAYLFPQQWMLEKEQYEGKKFSWRDIDTYIRSKIEDILKDKDQFKTGEVKTDDEGLKPILFEYQKIKPDKGSTQDRSTTRYFIGKVLDYLYNQGFIVRQGEDQYHPTKKFKIHTRQLLEDPNFQELLELGEEK